MSLVQWNPLREMDELLSRFQRGIVRTPLAGTELESWAPVVDITENAKEYAVKAELPGVSKEDVKIQVQNGLLTLTGERKAVREDKDEKYHRIERSYGAYSRSFMLPDDVLQDKITADAKEGVITVHLPKADIKKSVAAEIKIQ